jgi:hypothetical protein
MNRKDRRGMLGGLAGNIIAIVVAIIILVIGLVIVQELRDTQITGEEGCNSTDQSECYDAAFVGGNKSLVGLGTFSNFIPLIVLAVAASVIIGLILVGFAFGGRRR